MVNNNKQYFWLFSLVICMELFVFNFFLWLACAQTRPKIVFFYLLFTLPLCHSLILSFFYGKSQPASTDSLNSNT